jgi:hypothetical protein
MQRRDFITTSLGVGTYSLFVKVDDASAATNKDYTADDIRRELERVAPKAGGPASANEKHMTQVELKCDVLVAGGGMAGVCAALAAARNGAKVVLAQDRSRLGGNASSEIKMHIVGADSHGSRPGWREGGIIEELRLENAAINPQRSWEIWDLLLYDKVISEPNITLLLDSVLYSVEMKDDAIQTAYVRCDKSEHIYQVKAAAYVDCTGDARLGLEAGAEMRWGKEARDVHNEPLAPVDGNRQTLGSSILFTSRLHDKPMPYKAPKWARKITPENLYKRGIGSWEYGYWWIEWGGMGDTIRDNERIRFELLSIVLGVWDYIKNSGKYPKSENWALEWVGMVPGKREARRLIGDHVLTQQDCMGLNGEQEDAVCIGGWNLDEHPSLGFDGGEQKVPPYVTIRLPDVYNIPYRCLYSKNVKNLLMAGRNISASHVAFTSTRVMATCAVQGQAAGTAAALCARHKVQPRALYEDKAKLAELQQTLLRDDQAIKGLKNNDPLDLARTAKVTASATADGSKPENVLSGFIRDMPKVTDNRWMAPITGKPTLELSWDKPQTISRVQLTLDSGMTRGELTLTSADSHSKKMILAPQPELLRDYKIEGQLADSGKWETLAEAKDNLHRLVRHEFAAKKVKAIRLTALATNGDEFARVYEVRAYA